MERALQRARDKARQLKEKSAIQLAREQGRRIGYEEGLEKGRLVIQMQALAAARIQDSSDSQGIQAATGALRRALTQGPNDSSSHRHRSSRIRRNSLNQHTRRSSGDRESVARPSVRQSSADNATSAPQVQESPTTNASASRPVAPTPSGEHVSPAFLQQVRSDASRGSAGSRDNTTSRPAIHVATEVPQSSQPPPPPPPIPPPGVFTQARSDGSQSSGSGSSSVRSRRTTSSSVRRASAPQQQNGTDRPAEQLDPVRPTRPLETTNDRSEPQHRPRQGPSDGFPFPVMASQARRRDPAPYPGVPPAKQFPAGIPRDGISEAATSPTSSVDEIAIIAHPPATRPPSVIFTPQPPQPPPAAPVHQHGGTVDGGGSSRRTRERPPPIDPVIPENARPASRTGGPGAAPSPTVHHSHGPMPPPPMPPVSPHIQVPQWFVFPPPDQSAIPVGGTSTPVHRHQDPHHFLSPVSPTSPAFTGGGTGSNRSSLSSFEFQVVPPVRSFHFSSPGFYLLTITCQSHPGTPTLESEESRTGEDAHFLSPNSRPISLPSVQPQPQPRTPPPTFSPHHTAHEESSPGPVIPVLPVLPRLVSQPTIYGTPATRSVDLGAGESISRPGTTPPAPVYQEAPTPAGFEYPAPLGSSSTSQGATTSPTDAPTITTTTTTKKGKGKKRRNVTLQPPQEDNSSIVRPASSASGFYGPQPSSSSSPAGGAVLPPVVPMEPILPVAPPTISPVLPPMVMPVLSSPGGGGVYRNPGRGGNTYLEEEISDTSFDSATKRNTQMNAQMYGQGKW